MMSSLIDKNPEVMYYRKLMLGNKIPKLANMFKMRNITPHKMQKDVIEVWDNQYKTTPNLALPSGRRVGKSFTVVNIVMTEMVKPQASVVIIAPSNKQVPIIFDSVVKEVKRMQLPIAKIDMQTKYIKLQNGAEFRGGSEKTMNDLEGFPYSLLIIDESGLIKDLNKIINSLKPSLATYGVYPDTGKPLGRIILLGTPKEGAIDYYNIVQDAKTNDSWFVGQYPTSINPSVSPEFLTEEKERMDEQTYRQEYLGEFVAIKSDLVFYSFEPSKHIKDLTEIKQLIDKNSNCFSGLDIGATDHSSYVYSYTEKGKFYIIDSFSLNNIEEQKIAEQIKLIDEKYKTEPTRFIDPSAKLTRLGLASTYDIPLYPAKNAIRESVAIINQLFRQNKIFIDSNLHELIKQLELLMWNTNKNSKDPFKKIKGHHFDLIAAFRYLVFTTYKQYTSVDNVIDVV